MSGGLRRFKLSEFDGITTLSTVLLFVFLTTKQKEFYGGATLPFYSYGLVFSLILLVCKVALFERWKLPLRSLLSANNYPFCMLLVLLMGSALFSSEQNSRAIKDGMYFLTWVLLVIPFLTSLCVQTYDPTKNIDYQILAKSVVITGVISAFLSVIIFFDIFEVSLGGIVFEQSIYLAFRLHGIQGESTALAALLGVAFIFLQYTRVESRFVQRIIGVVLLGSLLFTASRNAILSLFCVYIARLFFDFFDRRTVFSSFLLMQVFFLFAMAALYLTPLYDVVVTMFFDRPDLDLSNKFSRPYIWLTTLEFLKAIDFSEALFGVGYGALRSRLSAGFNTPLEILHDFGVISFLLLLVWVVASVLIGVDRYRKTRWKNYRLGVDLIIFGFVFCNFMSYIPTPFFNFAPAALIMGCLFVAKRPAGRIVGAQSDARGASSS